MFSNPWRSIDTKSRRISLKNTIKIFNKKSFYAKWWKYKTIPKHCVKQFPQKHFRKTTCVSFRSRMFLMSLLYLHKFTCHQYSWKINNNKYKRNTSWLALFSNKNVCKAGFIFQIHLLFFQSLCKTFRMQFLLFPCCFKQFIWNSI